MHFVVRVAIYMKHAQLFTVCKYIIPRMTSKWGPKLCQDYP